MRAGGGGDLAHRLSPAPIRGGGADYARNISLRGYYGMIINYDKLTLGELEELGRIAEETCGLELTACTSHIGMLNKEVENGRN